MNVRTTGVMLLTVIAAYTDTDGTSPDPTYQSCSVTVTQVGTFGGAPAIGTFWASLGIPGSTREITNGTFTVPHEGPAD